LDFDCFLRNVIVVEVSEIVDNNLDLNGGMEIAVANAISKQRLQCNVFCLF
jgi:hypothetical protein